MRLYENSRRGTQQAVGTTLPGAVVADWRLYSVRRATVLLWFSIAHCTQYIRLYEEGRDLGAVVIERRGVGHTEVRLLHVQLPCRHVRVLGVTRPKNSKKGRNKLQ